jgi:amino acid adenylation domain-containing protein
VVEEMVSGIWQEVLGRRQISVEANFFSLGGHSLLATQVLSRIHEAFQVKLPLRSIFETPTIAGLASQVADALKAGSNRASSPIKRVSRQAALPLSFAQQRLWFLQQWEPVAAAYNIPAAVRLKGFLDVSALARSLEEMLRRHEALRTIFQDVNGQPVQVISPPRAWSLPVVELSSLSAEEREAEAMRLAREESQHLFDLSEGPLLRASLLRLAQDEHILLLTMHHIVSDGWSIGVFIRELTALYKAFSTGQPSALPSLPVQYADFAHWQRERLTSELLREQLAYWKRQLGGSLPTLELPTMRPRPPRQTFNGATESFALAPDLSEALNTLSRKHGVTLFMSLVAAFQTLLYRYTGQEDILVGTPVAGRTRLETENLIGFFVNTLVLRTDLSGAPSFAELLNRVREVSLEADLHQDVPFELLVEELQPERSLRHTPLFQVMFAMQNAPLPELSLQGLSVKPIEIESEAAKFELTLSMRETREGLVGTFEYNTDLFDQASMTRMVRHFEQLLEGVVAEPEQRITDVAMLTEDERRQLLIEWNETTSSRTTDQLLHHLFEAQAARTPDGIALIVGDDQLSYAELNKRANQLARHLIGLGVTPESRVGLLTERNTEMIVAVLGVLKAGAAYVPLDPQYPQERIAFMLADSGARVLLTQAHLAERLTAHSADVVCLDADQDLIARQPGEAPSLPAGAQPNSANLAYVIYTSGSTGRPKGVAITHDSAGALLGWAHSTFAPEHFAGVLASTSICFDLSIFELFVPLTSGGTVILADNALHLPLLPARGQVTLINTVPSAMAELVRSAAIPASVRVVNLAGEPLTTRLTEQVYASAGVEQVWNLYGPTEDTTYSTAVLVEREVERMTIGRPLAGTQAYVLDDRLQPVPVGVSGELYLGGEGLARGYLGRPELTAERFIPDPFGQMAGGRLYRTGDLARYLADAEIEYLGRLDHQVKVRGFRIELGEIEAALEAQVAVKEAVVVARAEASGDGQRLVAYVVGEGGNGEVEAAVLRRELEKRLPHYMVPSAFVVLDELPLTPNGKIDRKALPEPEAVEETGEQSEQIGARTVVEEMVSGIWQEVLGRRQISVEANFFSLGGHSLLATQVLSRVKQTFQVEIRLSALFETPTIAALAAMIEENKSRPRLDSTPTLMTKSRNERKLNRLRTKLEQLPEHEAKKILAEKKRVLNRETNDV